jgi:integrase
VKALAVSKASLAIDDVAVRLWEQRAQHDADADATASNLARLVAYFGKAERLTDIDHSAAREMVAWRRGHHVRDRADRPLISNATVNRSTTKVLQRLFNFAKDEGAVFGREPKWSELWLDEPEERVRELQAAEAEALNAAMRDDYAPFFAFARASGMRLRECVTLRWSEINFGTRQIIRLGKGGRRVVFPITPTIRDILFPLQGQHEVFVFTYLCRVHRKARVRGRRYPLTVTGVKSTWKRLRAAAGVSGFRFHDFRHDFGSKLLRKTGNIKLVQRALNHRSIASTLRYAHVLDEDIAAAVEQVAADQVAAETARAKSRPTPRSQTKKVM